MQSLLLALLAALACVLAQTAAGGACCLDDGSCALSTREACSPGTLFFHEAVECAEGVCCLADADCADCDTCGWNRLCQSQQCLPGACCVHFDDSRGTQCFETEGSDSCSERSFCADGSCTASYRGDGASCTAEEEEEAACPSGCYFCARSREFWANNYDRLPQDLALGSCVTRETLGGILSSEHTANAWTRLAQQHLTAMLNFAQQSLAADCLDSHEHYFGSVHTCFVEADLMLSEECDDIPEGSALYPRAVECAEQLRQFNSGTTQATGACREQVLTDEAFMMQHLSVHTDSIDTESAGYTVLGILSVVLIAVLVLGCVVYLSLRYSSTAR